MLSRYVTLTTPTN